jgi:hypothetical protein
MIATFGSWVRTLADLELLDLELKGLAEKYSIYPINKQVKLITNKEKLKLRVAHLETIDNERSLYAELVNLFESTNAYAFHNLYPIKANFIHE